MQLHKSLKKVFKHKIINLFDLLVATETDFILEKWVNVAHPFLIINVLTRYMLFFGTI